jgi:hypothetical protein
MAPPQAELPVSVGRPGGGRSLGTWRCSSDGGGGHLHEEKAVPTRILIASQRHQARPRGDRELFAQVEDLPHDPSVVTRVGYEEDRALGAQIALLRPKSPDDGLDVGEACLRLDDGIKLLALDHAIPAARVTGERDRYFRTPLDGRGESRSEPCEQREMGLVPHRRIDRMDGHAQLSTQYGGHACEQVQVDVGGKASLDPPHLRMGDADHTTELARTDSGRDPQALQFLAGAMQEVPPSPGSALRSRPPSGHLLISVTAGA